MRGCFGGVLGLIGCVVRNERVDHRRQQSQASTSMGFMGRDITVLQDDRVRFNQGMSFKCDYGSYGLWKNGSKKGRTMMMDAVGLCRPGLGLGLRG